MRGLQMVLSVSRFLPQILGFHDLSLAPAFHLHRRLLL